MVKLNLDNRAMKSDKICKKNAVSCNISLRSPNGLPARARQLMLSCSNKRFRRFKHNDNWLNVYFKKIKK